MYYHQTPAFDNSVIITEQEIQSDQGNNSTNNWLGIILGLVVTFVAGIVIWNLIKSNNSTNSKPDRNPETADSL